jgi:hypothetical protein
MSDKSALHGKAFEHAVLHCLHRSLGNNQRVALRQTPASLVASKAFESLEPEKQAHLDSAASAGVTMLLAREPRLSEATSQSSELELFLQSDQKGQEGDVRDIVVIRREENWQIGISAKHHHKAVKSSRLGKQLDFGRSWLAHPCSESYKASVKQVFEDLSAFVGNVRWRDLGDHGVDKYAVYQRVLEAFRVELACIYSEVGSAVPARLIRYLIGNYDFYKLMKIRDRTQLQAFNLGGSLGQRSRSRKPSPEPQLLKLPKKIYDIHFSDEHATTTVIVACDQGWQLSFRIHNASEFVEPSLKFDITLVGHPAELATQEMSWKISQ